MTVAASTPRGAHPLLFNAAELLRRPGSERTIDVQTTIDGLDIADDSRLDPVADVHVHLHLEALTDGIVVDGEVQLPWRGTCRRCLIDLEGTVTSEVHELYQQVVTDQDAFPIVGDQLDLRPMVRETVVLDAPGTPLCRGECLGLCPQCGVNRNDESCGCTSTAVDPRWAVLADLADGPGPAEDASS